MTAILLIGFSIALLTGIRASGTTNYAMARKVVYAIFPASSRAYALKIVGCETGHTYSRFTTGSQGERGYFQIHPSNAGRRLYDPRSGRLVGRIDFAKMYQPWANVKVAYYMSHGGRSWGEWTCSRYVH